VSAPLDPASSTRGAEFRADLRRAGARAMPPDVLAELTRLDPWRSAWSVLVTVGGLATTIGIALAWWTPWVVIPAMVLVAVQQHALFVLAHEAAHYRLASNRQVNDWLGRLLASSAGISMCSYRVIHRLHHNHLYGEEDPDIALHGGYPRGRAYLRRKLALDLVGITAFKTYRYFFGAPALDTRTNRAQRPLDDTSPALRAAALADRRGVILLQVVLLVAIALAFGAEGLIKYGVLWVLPAATVLQAILRIRAIAEHGAPGDTTSPFTAARTNVGGRFPIRLLFPHHVNHHIEHHLYPAVPHYHLPRLHARLVAEGFLRDAEVRSFGATWSRVYADRAVTPA